MAQISNIDYGAMVYAHKTKTAECFFVINNGLSNNYIGLAGNMKYGAAVIAITIGNLRKQHLKTTIAVVKQQKRLNKWGSVFGSQGFLEALIDFKNL